MDTPSPVCFEWSTDGDSRWTGFVHESPCLAWFRSGGAAIEANRTLLERRLDWVDARSSSLCLLTRGEWHLIQARGPHRDGLALRLDQEDLAQVLNQEDAFPELLLPRPAFNDQRVVRVLLQLWQAQRCGAPASTLKLGKRSIAHLLLEREGRAPRQRGARRFSPAVRRQLEDAIDESLGSDVDATSLAAALGISVSHFDFLFRATFGTSLHQFVTRARIDAASTRIRAGAGSIQEIASEFGFASAAHFATTFRRIQGQSPSQYRSGWRRSVAARLAPA